jgi:ribosomal-protein-alanine N-acetyltransferase
MSAVPHPAAAEPPLVSPMGTRDVDAVLTLEELVYPFPWTRGNFIDSLAAGYPCSVLRDPRAPHALRGYFVAMHGVQEMHLLNLTVAPAWQGRGHARLMLDRLVSLCRASQARQLWLEVRQSNARARTIYADYGFTKIGMRRGYYPAPAGQREDAVVMGLAIDIVAGGDALD